MARRKNVKRIDPRYFLHETVNRNDDGSRLEEELEEVLEEEEIEEGFKDFVQGAKDTFKDITKGRKLGKTREYRKQADAERKEYEEREARVAARAAARKKRGDEMDKAQAAAREKERSPEAMARRARESERRYRDSMRLTPDEKRRARQERDAKFKSKQYDKDQERMCYKDKRVGNVGYVGSGGVGSSRRYNEE